MLKDGQVFSVIAKYKNLKGSEIVQRYNDIFKKEIKVSAWNVMKMRDGAKQSTINSWCQALGVSTELFQRIKTIDESEYKSEWDNIDPNNKTDIKSFIDSINDTSIDSNASELFKQLVRTGLEIEKCKKAIETHNKELQELEKKHNELLMKSIPFM